MSDRARIRIPSVEGQLGYPVDLLPDPPGGSVGRDAPRGQLMVVRDATAVITISALAALALTVAILALGSLGLVLFVGGCLLAAVK